MKPITTCGNLIAVPAELWRDAEGKARRKAAKALLCGPQERPQRRPRPVWVWLQPDPA